MTEEEMEIQKIESNCFLEILKEFHGLALTKHKFNKPVRFWNLFCTIREKYDDLLKELDE